MSTQTLQADSTSTSEPLLLASLGMACQCAHQLGRFAEAQGDGVKFVKGPFDWLICPPEAAARWLLDGLEDFGPGEIVEERGYAYWPKHEFWFWHGFHTKAEDGKRLDIAATLERERAKLAYQRKIFRGIDPARAHFFISNMQNNLSQEVFSPDEMHRCHFDSEKIDAVRDALEAFLGASARLHVVTRADRVSAGLSQHADVHVLEPGKTSWKGDDAHWDAVISQVLNDG